VCDLLIFLHHTSILVYSLGESGGAGDASALKLSRLNLVDLAGSERAALMGETGTRLEESKKINLSLSALAKVMSSKNKNDYTSSTVPFQSKERIGTRKPDPHK